ncbi:MAG: hypothetical protein KJ674_02270 [Nanoarchaeota archaeon]|nr:hypothetical protein [Nanoarchaeota archaeon]
MKREVYEAIATLIGTIIGAGILGIPYVISKSGFLIGLVHIVIIGLIILAVNLFIGEVVLRTKGNHQLTGYAAKYFGKYGKIIMTVLMVFGINGVLIAYLIGGSESLSAIFGGNIFYYFIGYFLFMSILIFIGLKAIRKTELIMSGLILFIVLIISLIGFTKFDIVNIQMVNLSYVFYPYGIVLLAFLGGMAAIPEMKEELVNNKKELKKAIMIGVLVPLIVYILFSFVVLGVTGINTYEIATLGLSNVFGWQVALFGNLFALFAVSTGFLVLGLALKEMYNYDFKLNKNVSWFLACIPPFLFLVFFWNLASFKNVLNVTGALFGGLESIFIILIYYKAKKMGDRNPEYSMSISPVIGGLMILMFIVGIVFGLNLI